MATIRFFTRTITTNKDALVPMYVRLRSGRKIDIICKVDILLKPDNWSNEKQQIKQRADVFKFHAGQIEEFGKQRLNEKVIKLRAVIESELMNISQNNINSDWLRTIIDKLWNPDKYRITLFSFIQSFIDKSETKPNLRTGRPVSYKMRREYAVTFNYLKEYAKNENKAIDFKDIDLEFYDGFMQFLQNKKLAVNTIGKKIQTLKIFLNAAKEENKNTYEGYKSRKFRVLTEEAETIYLNESELAKLSKYDFSDNPAFDQVRDLFLVGCWTGCRFSDIAQIIPENISNGSIHLKQYKTGTPVIIPLHPVVDAIIKKYNGSLPKAISNQKFNKYLKDIARLSEINESVHKSITKGGVKVSKKYKKYELVTTHTARRSFATNLYKSGFPTLSIKAITGHKTEESFLKYIKVTPDEHAEKLKIHWSKSHLKVV